MEVEKRGGIVMQFRRATKADLPLLMELLTDGKQQLAKRGIDQWQGEYPSPELIEQSIDQHHTFLVAADDNQTIGTLTIQEAPDEAYANLDGNWLKETDAYVTIHRVAIHSQHAGKGYATKLFEAVINHLIEQYPQVKSIRIDTHEDNKPMQGLLAKLGFVFVGKLNEVYAPGEISVVYEYLCDRGKIHIA